MSAAENPDIDVIVGDWMSEANMTVRGAEARGLRNKHSDSNGTSERADLSYLSRSNSGYDPYFLEQLAPAIVNLRKNKIKLACNAGGSNPGGLAEAVRTLCRERGCDLKVAHVQGDDVSDIVLKMYAEGHEFRNLTTDGNIQQWAFEPLCAQCYLGGAGVAQALDAGADIVICGRIADASALTGACMWWHGWNRTSHVQEMASALVAGHLTECSSYVTGGCFANFQKFNGKDTDLAFPIVWIEKNGEFEIGMEDDRDGEVSVETITSQLIYEIQGPLYFNSDVVANLETIQVKEVSPNRIRVTGVTGTPAPPTTKVGITAKGGYRAEFHYYLTGLDIEEKAAMLERQTLFSIGKNIDKFECLTFNVAGTAREDAMTQNEATVDLRIFAQSREADILSAKNFGTWCKHNILQSYPGGTPQTDARLSVGRPFFEYWVSLLPQSAVTEHTILWDGTIIQIPGPTITQEYPLRQRSYETNHPSQQYSTMETVLAPFGRVVLGRSGDKSSDVNVGFFVRQQDEWDWLRSWLTRVKLIELIGSDYKDTPIERFEISGLRAVHFLLRDYLDRGYNASSGFDCLGKNFVEYIRSKRVEMPKVFLERYYRKLTG